MTEDELVRRYPRLYHMAETGSWPSIQEHGLLSTTALLDLFEISGLARVKIESQWRCVSLPIGHRVYGTAIIRDQKPMPEEELTQVLDGLTPRQWYEFLNRKTFFWAEEERLNRLLNGVEYRNRSHLVIVVDTRALLKRHAERITLSNINSGFARWGGKRGLDTFRPIDDFPSGDKVWELAVDYSIPDVVEFVLRVEERKSDAKLALLWERKP